jgi:hypothetical protein
MLSEDEGGGDADHHVNVHVAGWNWEHVGVYITITLFIVGSGLAKVGESV